jgi:hypothetical protein
LRNSFTCYGCCSSCAIGARTLTGDFHAFFFLSGDAVAVNFFFLLGDAGVVDFFLSRDDADATSFLSSAPCSIELQRCLCDIE